MEFNLNKYQTPITDELLNSMPEEIKEQFLEAITTIPFIKNLISSDRKYAKDLPRDDRGRIIVDLSNPHILEDVDYFRQAAIHFEKYGCYTFLRPNSNPNSEYRKFWDEEKRRCYEGMVREEDGEWVTGLMYFSLNYFPILINEIQEGSNKAIRKESFPYFWEGIYWRFHDIDKARESGKHAIELARRGCGKSISLAVIMARTYILGESEKAKRKVITILTAYQKEYLKDSQDGTLNKFIPELSFTAENTPFPRLMLKNSPNEMSWRMGYKDEFGVTKGSLNQVMAVSAKDDSDKLRGKRGWILYEEMGNFKGLIDLYDVTRKSVEEGDYTFGLQYLVGTANNKESDFSSAKTLLYSPSGYNIFAVPNVYDKPNQGKAEFGFFFPAYINRAGCYNKDGVSDVTKALLQIFRARYIAKYKANDPRSVLKVIAEDPITPAEAIIKVKSAYFPTTALTERLLQLDANPDLLSDVYTGTLVQLPNGKVEWKPTTDEPIRKFPVDNSTVGCIEIFQMPEKDAEEHVFANRYIIGHDPVDNDEADSSSLSSPFVFDLFTDSIVAEYTGRHQFADENYEIVRLLCLFYNAKCLYENNIKGFYAYMSTKNATHL